MDHDKAAGLVSDWVGGALEPAIAEGVALHVASCAECRLAADGARALWAEAKRAQGAPGEHPIPDQLARYIALPSDLASRELALVGGHLRSCDACRQEVILMRDALAPSALRSWRAALAGLPSIPRALQPVIAVVAIALVLPAWNGLVVAPRELADARLRLSAAEESLARVDPVSPPALSLPGGGAAVLVLRGATRAASSVPIVRLRAGQSMLALLLDVTPPLGPLTVRVLRADGAIAWSSSGPREEFWDEANQLVGLMVPVQALAPGRYRVELLAAAEAPAVLTAEFEVISSPAAP